MSNHGKPRPNPRPMSLRERGCTSKIRFDSPGEAELAAMTRMLVNADRPLEPYACTYCAGFHLTSTPEESYSTRVHGSAPVARTDAFAAMGREIGRQSFQARRKKWLRREEIRIAQRRRQAREVRRFFEKNPPPQVATDEEVAQFFARYAKSA